jgi:hypothetical protein
MKHFLFLFLFLVLAFKANAQAEFGPKFKPIPPAKFPAAPKKKVIPPAELPKIEQPNVFNSPENPNKASTSITKSNDVDMFPKEKFINVGEEYLKKMQKDVDKTLNENNMPLLRRNFDFGQINTKSKYVIVRVRDFIYVDGDLLRIYQNATILKEQVFLGDSFTDIKILLGEGFNKLDFEALNTGTSGGNTAEIIIIDDQKKVLSKNYWDNLATGFKGTILLVKE